MIRNYVAEYPQNQRKADINTPSSELIVQSCRSGLNVRYCRWHASSTNADQPYPIAPDSPIPPPISPPISQPPTYSPTPTPVPVYSPPPPQDMLPPPQDMLPPPTLDMMPNPPPTQSPDVPLPIGLACNGNCVRTFRRCGGVHHVGSQVCCMPGVLCVKKNKYYSQCRPTYKVTEASWDGSVSNAECPTTPIFPPPAGN